MNLPYRSLVVGLLIVQIVWFLFPWGVTYQNGTIAALAWFGVGSLVEPRVAIAYSTVLFFAYIGVYLGMFFYLRIARAAFVAVAVLGGLVIPVFGISVQSGYEGALGYFATLGDGLLIGLSYFSESRLRFGNEAAGR